jgi:hypothetical protein
VTDEPTTEPTPSPAPTTTAVATISPDSPVESVASTIATKTYGNRFRIVYAFLGLVLLGAGVGMVVLATRPEAKPAPPWSSWQPTPDTVAKMSSEIADHVAHSYRVAKGGRQLVNVVPSRPTVTSGTTKISIEAIAIRKAPNNNAGIEVLTGNDVSGSQMFTFCGLGANCSIPVGKASQVRGRLVRREALEVALYTFKFVPSIKSVIAFLPPSGPNQTESPLMFLRKADLQEVLDKPLRHTLRRVTPPLPNDKNETEAKTIDDLTLPNVFSYSLQALQTGGAAFVLDPAT